MDIRLREGRIDDAERCGTICYEAFKSIADQHNFPPDFPSPKAAIGFLSMLFSNRGFYSVVAESDGRIVGSDFLDERSPIAGIGPISVDPRIQNQTIGRTLMLDVMARARDRGFAGVRLLQAAYHNRSFALYAKLGFEPRTLVAVVQGPAMAQTMTGYVVRQAAASDLDDCNRICFVVHGHDRSGGLQDAIAAGTATVVERAGRITGYATSIGTFAHAVAKTNDDLKALIAASGEYSGMGFLVPVRNSELLRWCFGNGLRLVYLMTLMTIGLYNEPQGAWLPSVLY
jgi:GNAT superfamily N-acetyltransferase